MSAATDDKHIRAIIDRLDLFGFRAPVVIPPDIYPDYLHHLAARSEVTEAESAAAEVSEA
ncbi:MAG TPA: hypothetical protein VFP03_07650 [Jiangellaceae bacterium]|nr:hypothetical protein [Jiangellaceae bacterium]